MDLLDGGASEKPSGAEAVGVSSSLYAALGLSSEDVDALAQIPESEISVETLPYLIMQLKAKRAQQTSSTTDTDHRDKSQEKLNTPERRKSPPLSSGSARSHGSHEHEHHGKGEGHRKGEKQTGGRKDDTGRCRKSSRESQSGDHVPAETELGDTPTVFPYNCSLCNCRMNSKKTWNEHLSGFRHKSHEAQSSPRSSRSYPSKRPHSSDHSAMWDPFMSSSSDRLYPPKANTKVVVAKFSMGAVTVEELLVLGKPFGTIVKHLVFPAKGFLEFSSHKEAQNMVSHFKLKPAFIKENRVILYLSPTVEGIHSPPKFDEPSQKRTKRSNPPSVVCFSRLPPGEGVEDEVLELAGMFGEVWQSKFTDCKALIEMVDWRDADIMVKYYYSNPLRIQGKSVKVAMSHITSLRENSTEPPSRKSDSSKYGRQRDESTSSNKDKGDNANQEATEKENQLMESEDKVLDNEEGIQLEDESGLLDEGTDDTAVNTEEEEKKGEEERLEEERATNADEENRERDSQQNQDELDDEEFPENIEDFVTLDELDNTAAADSALAPSVSKDGRVVVVWPIKKTPDLMKDLCYLAAPFGRIVKHILSVSRQQAMIELESGEIAQEMVQFYRDHKARVCGRPVSISISRIMKTIESPSWRSVFISGLPNQRFQHKYTKESLLNLGKPFGKLTAYSLAEHQATCYMQFESAKAAQRMVARYKRRPCKFWGSILKIVMSRKGDSMIRWTYTSEEAEEKELKKEEKQIKPSSERTGNDQEIKSDAKESQQSSLPDCEGVGGDSVCEGKGSEEVNQQEKTPLSPSQSDHIVGVDYVIPVTGFFCKLCNIFYTDESKAKSQHCRSLEHHNNFKLKHAEVVEPADGHLDG
ncbi:RNA-binding protein 20 [Pimephales promelas]|uniref:RNA-binding protein 20 n=1 Tax=Pimephales promelas TaxID=90988 RepID=UPI001955A661|nr:RNA-binding protein 20 [Pimephales promelas]